MAYRQTPRIVLLTEVGYPLVESGGKRLDTLREDFYDLAVHLMNNNATRKYAPLESPYDLACSGGEPYSVWS